VIADDGINRAELQTEASVASEGDMAAYDPQTYVLIDPPPLRKLCEKTEYCELYEGHEGDCDDGIPF
jgi:hypothetical protein